MMELNQGTELVEWLAQYAVEMLQDEATPCPDPQELLSAANDWVAIAFEKQLTHKPERSDLCLIVQASILATHTYLVQQAADGQRLLYTFGYTMLCAEAIIEQLVALGVLITDIRYSANSRAAKWRKARLQRQLGEHYFHLQALGNVNYNRPGPIQLYQAEVGVSLAGERLQQGQHLAFMCMCPQLDGCHREVAAQKMCEQFPALKVIHL
jgi:hypothetical protein